MKIKKVSGTAVLNGNVIDSLADNSTTNAPSQRAVRQRFEYSTEEQMIGIWIDDRPVYRKVISTDINLSGVVLIDHNINNIDNMINVYGNLKRSDNTQFIVTRISDDGNNIGILSVSSEVIKLYIPPAFASSITEGNLILEYTKTTD